LIFPSEIDIVLLAVLSSLKLALDISCDNCLCHYTSMYKSILNCSW